MINFRSVFKSLSNIIDGAFLTATQLAFTCSELTTETLEQGKKYVQS